MKKTRATLVFAATILMSSLSLPMLAEAQDVVSCCQAEFSSSALASNEAPDPADALITGEAAGPAGALALEDALFADALKDEQTLAQNPTLAPIIREPTEHVRLRGRKLAGGRIALDEAALKASYKRSAAADHVTYAEFSKALQDAASRQGGFSAAARTIRVCVKVWKIRVCAEIDI